MTFKLTGQWWERQGYVVFLPIGIDPNDDPTLTGWVKASEDRARVVLDGQPK